MIEEMQLLCDRIRRLSEDAIGLIQSEALKMKHDTLQEIMLSIDKLTRANIDVPPALLDLSESLSTEAAQRKVAELMLQKLYDNLGELKDTIKPFVRVKSNPSSPRLSKDRPEPRMKSSEPVTPMKDYVNPILEILRELGGSAHAKVVIAKVHERMKDHLLPGDYCERDKGDKVWRNNIRWARQHLIERGILRNDSSRGIWELGDGANQYSK
jgi:hypothetical protein